MEKKEYTKTTTFLFPLLGLSLISFNRKNGSRLVDCFIYENKKIQR